MRVPHWCALGTIVSLASIASCTFQVGSSEDPQRVSSAGTSASPLPGDVLTQRVDNGRTGATSFVGLNAKSFASGFGLLATLPVQGTVYGQPLYAQRIVMADGSTHDLILVTTGENNVYAFDAVTFAQLWTVSLGAPEPGQADFIPGCLNADGTRCNGTSAIGVLSTPVVDRTRVTLDLAYRTTVSGAPQEHVVALSLTNGARILDHNVTYAAMNADGTCSGKDLCGHLNGVHQRASLLLSNGVLYVAFTLRDEEFWSWASDFTLAGRGEILAFDPATMNLLGSFVTVTGTPTRMGGGIWQASVGPAADANGDIYFATGNAMSYVANPGAPINGYWMDGDESLQANPHPLDYVPEAGSYGNSVVRLHPQKSASGAFSFSPVTSFTPNRSYWQNLEDIDLGSAGPMLVPGTNQLVHGGKESILYVLDRDNMGNVAGNPYIERADYMSWPPAGSTSPTACASSWFAGLNTPRFVPSAAPADVGPLQEISLGQNFDIRQPIANCWGDFPHIHGTPAFAHFADGRSFIYVWAEKDFLKAFAVESTAPLKLGTTPATSENTAPLPNGMPGGTLATSVDPTNGGGVIFASSPLETDLPANPAGQAAWIHGTLRAYDASPTAAGKLTQLWSNFQVAPYFYAKFVPPTIANGRVILATFSNEVLVYGPGAKTTPAYTVPSAGVGMAPEGATQSQTTAAFVASDGAVHVLWKGDGDGWDAAHNGQITAPGVAPPGAPVTLVASGGTLHAVFVDNRASVHWLSRAVPSAWVDHGSVSGAVVTGGVPRLGALVEGTALDVFLVEGDGSMHILAGSGPGAFSDAPIGGSAVRFSPGTNVAATTNGSGELDVFAVDLTGEVRRFETQMVSARWIAWGGAQVIGSEGTFPSGGDLAATTYGASLGVYGVDVNGIVTGFTSTSGSAFTRADFSIPGYAPAGAGVAVGSTVSAAGAAGGTFLFVVGNPGALDAFTIPAAAGPTVGPWTSAMAAHTRSFGIGAPGTPVAAFGNDVIVSGSNGLFAIPYLGGQSILGNTRPNAGTNAWSSPILLQMSPPAQAGLLFPELETIPVSGAYIPLQQWVSADFTMDGKADFANIWSASEGGAIGIDVYVNQGNGTFQWQPQWGKIGSTGGFMSSEKWVVGDYDHDGRPDLANVWSATEGGPIGIDVYLNHDNQFVFEPQWGKIGSTGGFMSSEKWVSGDFNRDGWIDLANVWSPADGGQIGIDLYVNSQDSGFTFQPQWGKPATQGYFTATQSWFAGDFDGDGWVDLADAWDDVLNGVPQIGIDVHLNNRASGFTLSAQWGAVGTQGVFDPNEKWVVGDFDRNGFPDLAKAFPDDNSGFVSIDVHLNSGSHTFVGHRWTTLVGPYNGGPAVFNPTAIPSRGYDIGQTWFAGAFHGDGLDFGYVYDNGGVAGIGEFYR